MSDMLDITEPQARVLRAIAYVESELGKKGATQYLCYKKVPNGFHVSNSTFSENIKELGRMNMVELYEDSNSKRNSVPYTITDIGQIAWLRYFPNLENSDKIKKVFPNIQIGEIDTILNEIDNTGEFKDKFAIGILKIALDSFHTLTKYASTPYVKLLVEERIELSGLDGLITKSYRRYYNVINQSIHKKLEQDKFIQNYHELDISVIDRITFLFYYNLIQLVTSGTIGLFAKIATSDIELSKVSKNEALMELPEEKIQGSVKKLVSTIPKSIKQNRKKILELITSNKAITKIMKNNLKQLKTYKDTSFQDISDMFLKV